MALRTKLSRYPITLPVTQKGQVTIPAAMRHSLGIDSPGHVSVFLGEDGDVHVRPISAASSLRGKYKPLPGSAHLSMDEIIADSLAHQFEDEMRDTEDE
jgi:AbrB family looped-hinge helix DNA binding protein